MGPIRGSKDVSSPKGLQRHMIDGPLLVPGFKHKPCLLLSQSSSQPDFLCVVSKHTLLVQRGPLTPQLRSLSPYGPGGPRGRRVCDTHSSSNNQSTVQFDTQHSRPLVGVTRPLTPPGWPKITHPPKESAHSSLTETLCYSFRWCSNARLRRHYRCS